MKIFNWLATITALVLVGTTAPLAPAQEIGASDESEVATHMHEHLTRITVIKSLIIMGNLDGVRDPARWLADHDAVAGLPRNFEPFVNLMREHAREVVKAANLKSAAVSVSNMARTCSNCHLANQVTLAFGFDRVPADWADTQSHMQRHQWAVDRLWEGLIGPSEIAWNLGADMLVDVPLHPDEVMDDASGEVDAVALDQMARRIHVLASQSANARTPTQRSDLYAEILGLCADCHTSLGRGPGQ